MVSATQIRKDRPIIALRILIMTIYALQAEGDFPMRVKITAHSVAWVEEEVQAWLTARIERPRSETAASETQLPQATRRRER